MLTPSGPDTRQQAGPEALQPADPRARRPSGAAEIKGIARGLILLNILAIVMCAAMLRWRWQDEIAVSRLQATNTAALLAHGANATLDKASLSLANVVDQVERAWVRGGLEPDAIWPMVDKATARVPELLAVGLFDRHGRQICGVPEGRCRHLNVADQDYLQRLRDTPTTVPLLSGPVDSRADGQPILVLAKALQAPDGSLGGTAVALLPVKVLAAIVGTASLGPHGAASLRMSDGLDLLARAPNLAPGQGDLQLASVAASLRDAMRVAPEAGVVQARSAVDGLTRVSAYQRLPGYPIVAVVGDATEDSLVGWRNTLYWTAGFLVMFGAASALLHRAVTLSHRRQAQAQRLYDEAPCGYQRLDSQGRFVSINETGLGWLASTREEIIGKQTLADFLGHAGRATFAASFTRLMAGEAVQGLEMPLVGRDGTVRQVAISATRVLDRHGRFLCVNSVMHDVTASKRAEDARLRAVELEAQNVALRESGRVKDEFVANMSHELRTPLNAVISLAHLLRTEAVRHDALKSDRYVRQIAESGQHLLGLVQTVLDFAKSEAGKLSFKPERVHVATVLQEVADMLLARQAAAGATVELNVEAGLDTVLNDAVYLRLMVMNLVSNAIKFSHAGGRVQLRARALDVERWSIDVEDHGIGIKAEDLGRLFQSFTQLSSGTTKAYAGAGLGLALVRQIARAQGGDVSVRSEFGSGSVFTLTLPRSIPWT